MTSGRRSVTLNGRLMTDEPFRDHAGWDMSLQTKTPAGDRPYLSVSQNEVSVALHTWNSTRGTDRDAMRAAIRAALEMRKEMGR